MSLERLLDIDAITACVRNIACGTDAHDWGLVADCFDQSVLMDYVSLAGGAPVQLTSEQVVEALKGLLPGFACTRHRLSNFRVQRRGGVAECRCYVDALHVIPDARGGDTWRVIGEYTHHLVRRASGWKVAGMRFEKDYLFGNQALPELAQARLQPRMLELEVPCAGSLLAGTLFLPGDWDENAALSAVLVCGSWLSLKEHMAGIYARAMAQMGFAALAFDHRGFGGSQGGSPWCEWPERKIEECGAAFSFLQNRPEIDFERTFGLGLGAGAGYMLRAAAGEGRIRGLALVCPWLHLPDKLAEIYGGEQRVRRLLQDGLEADETTARMVAADTASGNSAMAEELGWLLNFSQDAEESAASWDGSFAPLSWPRWLGFDPLAHTGAVGAPTLLIHSREAFFPMGVEMCFQRLGGPKSLVWMEGRQTDFYTSFPLRTRCIRRISDHFRSVSS